LMAS